MEDNAPQTVFEPSASLFDPRFGVVNILEQGTLKVWTKTLCSWKLGDGRRDLVAINLSYPAR